MLHFKLEEGDYMVPKTTFKRKAMYVFSELRPFSLLPQSELDTATNSTARQTWQPPCQSTVDHEQVLQQAACSTIYFQRSSTADRMYKKTTQSWGTKLYQNEFSAGIANLRAGPNVIHSDVLPCTFKERYQPSRLAAKVQTA